jgi:putative hydrolase
MPKRYDFHIHSLLTEGELLPSEIAQRCSVLNYGGITITDHVDSSNMEFVLGSLVPACSELDENFDLRVLAGVELTHVPPPMIEKLVKKARGLGAQVVVVHGETIVEPVQKGTNLAALKIPDADILAHPGLISEKEASLAKENDIFLEITSRKGHCLTNGHVAKTAGNVGAELLLNTDAHSPSDLITPDDAVKIAAGCGLSGKEVEKVLVDNPKRLLKRTS